MSFQVVFILNKGLSPGFDFGVNVRCELLKGINPATEFIPNFLVGRTQRV